MNEMTDSELRTICYTTLVGRVGPVNTERFIVMMNREPRDYTRWRETHYMGEGETIPCTNRTRNGINHTMNTTLHKTAHKRAKTPRTGAFVQLAGGGAIFR